MSRTRKGSKPTGYDYWSKRPYSGCSYGKHVKDMCHRSERMSEKELVRKETDLGIKELESTLTYDLKQDNFFKSLFPNAQEIICYEHYILGEVCISVDGVHKGYMQDYNELNSFVYFTGTSYKDVDDLYEQYYSYLEENEKFDWLP